MADSVLLIDDDVEILRAIGNYFEHIGYEVARELSGEAGLAAFERLRPEVVILDLHLPGMDGLEVLERLREKGAAVILLTGQSDTLRRCGLCSLGQRIFSRQPVDMAHFAAAAARAGDKARLRRINELLRSAYARAGPGTRFSLGRSPRHAGARPPGWPAGPERASHHSATGGRKRDGQGIGCADDSQPGAPGPPAVCRGQRRRIKRHLPGFRVIRQREGRLYRCEGPKTGPVRNCVRTEPFSWTKSETWPSSFSPSCSTTGDGRPFGRLGGTRELSVDVRLHRRHRQGCFDGSGGRSRRRFREDGLYHRLSVMPLHIAVRPGSLPGRSAGSHQPFAQRSPGRGPGGPESIRPTGSNGCWVTARPGMCGKCGTSSNVRSSGSRKAGDLGRASPGRIRAPRARVTRHNPLTLDVLERRAHRADAALASGNRTRAAVELGISRTT